MRVVYSEVSRVDRRGGGEHGKTKIDLSAVRHFGLAFLPSHVIHVIHVILWPDWAYPIARLASERELLRKGVCQEIDRNGPDLQNEAEWDQWNSFHLR